MNDIYERENYKALYPSLQQVERIAAQKIENGIRFANIPILETVHRIKTEDSAIEKLDRKSDNYRTVSELTDLIGFRLICYFSDDVDKIADFIKQIFVIDKKNSVDKRQLIDPTAFGYLSLHYICSLPESDEYPKNLCDIRFEIQMRSSLQHTWAEIEHDLGYKSVFEIPRSVRREFSRIAGLLELADESFTRILKKLNEYTAAITDDIKNDRAEHLTLDLITLKAYLKYNKKMNDFLAGLAALQNAKIVEHSPEAYLPRLEFLNINTLGDLEQLLTREYDHAFDLAKELFNSADLDEIATTAGLHFLCRADLIYGNHGKHDIYEFFNIGSQNEARARRQAKHLINKRDELK